MVHHLVVGDSLYRKPPHSRVLSASMATVHQDVLLHHVGGLKTTTLATKSLKSPLKIQRIGRIWTALVVIKAQMVHLNMRTVTRILQAKVLFMVLVALLRCHHGQHQDRSKLLATACQIRTTLQRHHERIRSPKKCVAQPARHHTTHPSPTTHHNKATTTETQHL